MVAQERTAEKYSADVSKVKNMASQKDHILCCTATFVTQRTVVRLVPQVLCALNMNLFALPSVYVFFEGFSN